MNDLFFAFSNSLVALGICIIAGYICRRTRLIDDTHTTGMSNLLVRVTTPCTVFMALMRPFSRELLFESLATVVITGVLFILAGYLGLMAAKLMKASPGDRQSWQFGVAFGNIGFMGIPVVQAVFGYEGLIYVAMALTSFNVLTFTVGARMFDNAPRGFSFKGLMMRNPAIPAVFIGLIFFVSGLRFPYAVESGISLIGGITAPISMILLGVILARQRIKDAFTDARLLVPVAAKLLVVPIMTFLMLNFIIQNTLMLGVIVTLMAMPPAVLTVIFAEQFDADGFSAAKFIVVGTMLCAVTVPLVSLLL